MLLVLLLGCEEEKPPEEEAVVPVDTGLVEATLLPVAAWDPVVVRLEDESRPEPYVEDADGNAVVMAELTAGGAPYGWRAAEDLPLAETLHLRGTPEHPDLVDEAFQVQPFGRDAAFDPANVLGKVYAFDGADWTPLPNGLGDLLWTYAGDLRLVVDAVDGTAATFRLITTPEVGADAARCTVLRATGTLSATGELAWSQDRIEAQTSPAPTVLTDLSLRVGFDADGSDAAGVEGGGTVDTRTLDGYLESGDSVCDLGLSLGATCRSCEDGVAKCLDARFHMGRMHAVDEVPAADLPLCGVDMEQAGEAVSCDWDGGTVCTVAFLPFVLFPLRRRRAQR